MSVSSLRRARFPGFPNESLITDSYEGRGGSEGGGDTKTREHPKYQISLYVGCGLREKPRLGEADPLHGHASRHISTLALKSSVEFGQVFVAVNS